MDGVTEFDDLNPEEFHLVGTAATGFPVLIAKAASDAIDEVRKDSDHKTLPKGTHVTWHYRSAIGHGVIEGVHKKGDSADTTEYSIRESDHHKGEPDVVYHYGSALTVAKDTLDAKDRHDLDDSDFAFPAERKEPIGDESHVRAAISRFSQVEGVSDDQRKDAARRIMARAKHFGIDVSDDSDVAQAAKQLAPDKGIPTGEAESQTREVDEGPGPAADPSPDDRGEPRSVPFPHPPAGDGQGDTAPDKSIDAACDEAGSQTASLGKAAPPSDGKGSRLPDGENEGAEEHEVEGQTRDLGKATPGSPQWEHKDVALGEKAEALATQLVDCIHMFTEREKAEGGASKSLRRAARTARSLLAHPNQLRKAAENMSDTNELVKVLGEYDKARRAEKKAEKKAEAKKAERKAAKAAKKAAKAADGSDLAKANKRLEKAEEDAAKARELAEKMAAEDGKRIPLNPAGVTAFLRDPANRESAFKSFEDRIATAQADLEQATKAKDEYAIKRTTAELTDARRSLTAMKMVAAERARESDPTMVARAMRGQGVPLLTNRHAIGEDNKLRSI